MLSTPLRVLSTSFVSGQTVRGGIAGLAQPFKMAAMALMTRETFFRNMTDFESDELMVDTPRKYNMNWPRRYR